MKEALEQLLDEVRCAWRFRWIAFATALGVALLGWAIVFALPDRFEADARVFVDTRTALSPALKGLTMDQNVDAQLNFVRQSLLAGPQLERIAVDGGVLPRGITEEKERAEILKDFATSITLSVASAGSQGDERSTAGSIYSIEYLDSDRARALRVVGTLLNTFVDKTLGGKREGSQQAQEFLEAQIKDYSQRLTAAEDRLAAFKKDNVGLMPSEQGGYFTQLQREVDAAKKTDTDLAIAVSRRDELLKQLRGDPVNGTDGSAQAVLGSARIPGGTDTLSRIQETQAKLDDLLLRYTDKHPDVIAARASLEELQKRRGMEMESLRRGDAGAVAASGVANSPVYQSIELELNKVGVDIAALRRESAQHEVSVAELRNRLDSAPQVEAEYQLLNRDYDVNKAEYTALVESYQKTRLGEQADIAGTVRFEVLQPPTSALAPVWPKRSEWLAEIWFVAMVLGAATAYGLHIMRPVVSSVRDLSLLTPFPVLGTVGIAFPSKHQFLFRRNLRHFCGAAATLVAALVVALLLNWWGVRLSVHSLKTLVASQVAAPVIDRP